MEGQKTNIYRWIYHGGRGYMGKELSIYWFYCKGLENGDSFKKEHENMKPDTSVDFK